MPIFESIFLVILGTIIIYIFQYIDEKLQP